ncbi:MAG TPA: acyl-ACP--UDP-N-acetylglucosamine O-acyltransferase [Caulobacteraceae bacterium]|nr:acyl-ACP--UDP-N-acetylglucosamine O-acyltransferase [Caulobacteraceae bacterium]
MKIHATAQVAPGAELADTVEVGPYCIVGAGAKLGPGVVLRPHVVIDGQTEIGEGCEVHPFALLGASPQHAAYKPGDPVRLVIGKRNLIREQVTFHGGSTVGRGVTRIGDNGTFYVGAHVGHDCIVGDHVTMTNAATLGGHVVLGDYVIMGGLSAIQQRSRVGRHAFIGGLAAVNSDVIPYGMVWGNHATLEGLNLVGLKRRGFSREQINALRAGFRALFGDREGPFRERLDAVADAFSESAEVLEIIEFIRAEPQRPLVMPGRGAAGAG